MAEVLPRNGRQHRRMIPTQTSKATIVGYRIDARNGTLHALPTSPYGDALANKLTITPDGAFLYAADFNTNKISGFSIDSTSGALWPLPSSPFKTGDNPEGIVSCRRVGDSCKTEPEPGDF
jgi:6-phosphogluconolactonase